MSARSYVAGASVAAKWILQEPGRDQALSFLDGYRRGRFRLFAPQLLVSEIGNVPWKKVQQQDLSAPKSEKAFSLLLTNCPVLLDPESVSAPALGLATAHRRTYHDSLYLALALGCELLTADKRLVVQGGLFVHAPWLEGIHLLNVAANKLRTIDRIRA